MSWPCMRKDSNAILLSTRLDSNRIRAVFGLVYLGLALPFDIKNAQHLSVVFFGLFSLSLLCLFFRFVTLFSCN